MKTVLSFVLRCAESCTSFEQVIKKTGLLERYGSGAKVTGPFDRHT